MFIPLKDDAPLQMIRMQYVCIGLIALNIIIFLLTGPLRGDEALMTVATGFGVVPTELLDLNRVGGGALNPVSEPFTLVTYMFLHGGWLHVLSNMAFLWVFADNIEDAFGHVGFLLFYVLCGIVAALVHAVMQPNSHEPLIGASGAMSGVLGAYLLLYPRARVWILLFFRLPLKIPAWLVLAGWFALQVFMLFSEDDAAQEVAWWSHIGGFAMGMLFTLALKAMGFLTPVRLGSGKVQDS